MDDVRTRDTYDAAGTVAEAARLVRTAFNTPGGPASPVGVTAMANARILLDLATVQVQAQQADALTRIANVLRNGWSTSNH